MSRWTWPSALWASLGGGGTKQRGWARRRENNDWVGRLAAEGEMWVSGVCVCAGVWRDGGRAGCGFSAVGIRVQAGKAGGKYEGRIAMGTYGWRWRSAFLFDSQGSRKSSGKHNLQENGHRRQNDHPGVSEEQQRQVGLKLTCLHYSPKVSGVWMKFQDAPTCTITFYRWTLFTDMLFAMKVIYHTNHKDWRLIRDWWTQNVLVQWQHVSACCSHFDVVRQDNA